MEVGEQLSLKQLKPETLKYIKENNLDSKKVFGWKNIAEKKLETYSKDLLEFAKGKEGLINIGNRILLEYKGTGFNIVLNENDMAIKKNEPLIFYNNYIGRTEHFALLLTEMEQKKIIEKGQISFGNKCSSVLYTEWPIFKEDEFIRKIKHPELDLEDKANQTVETVITFKPTSTKNRSLEDNALEIVRFLYKKADSKGPGKIPGSWKIPDIRATKKLDILLENPETKKVFKMVVSNILNEDKAELIVMRVKTKFNKNEWDPYSTTQNSRLVEFLSNEKVPE